MKFILGIFAFVFAVGIVYLPIGAGIESLVDKTEKTRQIIIAIAVSILVMFYAYTTSVNQNTVPLDIIERKWNEYTAYCKQERISWNELTFPEWLQYGAESYDGSQDYEVQDWYR